MSRETFHASLTASEKLFFKELSEKLFFKELAVKLGRLKYEGEKAPGGVVIRDYQPHRVKK